MSEATKPIIELIEAYGAARSTGNALLIQSAGNGLASYLDSVEIVPRSQPEPEPQPEPEQINE